MITFVFLHEGYADWELSFILPELIFRKRRVVTFARKTEPLLSMGGLRVTPDMTVEQVNLNESEALILPGGTFWESFANSSLDAIVREVQRRKQILAAICDATGYLAQLGLLDDVYHSSNSIEFLRQRAPNYRGHEKYRNDPATRDGKLVTADGFAALEFTRELTELYGIFSPEEREEWFRSNKAGKWCG